MKKTEARLILKMTVVGCYGKLEVCQRL